MKKLLFIAGLLILLTPSCNKHTDFKTEVEVEEQQQPTCGMEAAMANLSPEFRKELAKGTEMAASPASALLVFLDFDGAIVRRGFANPTGLFSPIIGSSIASCPPPVLTEAQKMEIIQLVKDDFSPFKIEITTDQAVFDAYTPANKQICIISTLPSFAGFPSDIGGTAPFFAIGSRLAFNPSFVFAQQFGSNLKEIAAIISHEVGHTMGLGHQHLFNAGCNYRSEYHPGFGNGAIAFAPIMGLGDKRITNWFAQLCRSPFFGVSQNDFVLLNSQVDLKEDDFPNAIGERAITPSGTTTAVLEMEGDADFIYIAPHAPQMVYITSENIDIKASMYSPGGHLFSEHNDPDDTGLTIPHVKGVCYLKIEAVSNVNMPARFMTGEYKVTY